MNTRMSVILMVSLAGIVMVHGYPTEPPLSFSTSTLDPHHVPSTVCESMNPHHGSFPSDSSAPYQIITSSKTIVPGATLRVTIRGIGDEKFKGIYVQGRVNGKPFGRFEKLTHDPLIVVSDCLPGEQNAASYISGTEARNEVALDWIAPASATSEEVIFVATIVKTYREFWLGVNSTSVRIEA